MMTFNSFDKKSLLGTALLAFEYFCAKDLPVYAQTNSLIQASKQERISISVACGAQETK